MASHFPDPMPPSVEARSPNHRTAREVPLDLILNAGESPPGKFCVLSHVSPMPGVWSASSCGAQRSLVLLMGKTLGFGVLETQGWVYHHRMKQAASLVKGREHRVSWISFKDLLTHLHREGWDFPGGVSGKRALLPMQVDRRDVGSTPGSGRSPPSRKWQPTLVFLPGESHGQRSLVGCSP